MIYEIVKMYLILITTVIKIFNLQPFYLNPMFTQSSFVKLITNKYTRLNNQK